MIKFVNPYNFIPFDKAAPSVKTREEQYRSKEDALKSGWMDISLYCKTPLIIPNGAYPIYIDPETDKVIFTPSEQQKKSLHKKYSFMKYADSYVIPGSELRGMIRSMYEAVTNSCVRETMDDKLVSQRVPTFSAINKRGLLAYKNGQWILYKTQKKEVKKFAPLNEEEAKLQKKEIENWKDLPGSKSVESDETYYLQYNVPVALNPPSDKTPEGQPYTIYKLKPTEIEYQWVEGDSEPYDKLKSSLKRERVKGNQKNSNEKCMKALLEKLESAKESADIMVPVYYFTVKRGDTTIVYMSGSSIGRIAHHRKWADVLEGHTPCEGPDYCPACLLFGSIKKEGLKGHIRITDAYHENGEIKSEYRTLDILGEPRASAFEFYYRRPEKAMFWNQDFYSYKADSNDNKSWVEFCDLEKATPRGRKMYWHSKPGGNGKKSELNSTMEALETDVPFTFKVYFDQITDAQLKDLMWTISLGENTKDSSRQYKLGHAKPLGYGSVKLVIDQIHTRTVIKNQDTIRYEIASDHVPETVKPATITLIDQSGKANEIIQSVLRMVDAKTTEGKKVAYPHLVKKNRDAIFNWFSSNRTNANRMKTLPEPTDRIIELKGSWLSEDDSVEQKTGNHGKTDMQNKSLKKNAIITVTINKCTKDKKDSTKWTASIYDGKGGRIFGLPKEFKQGDTVKMCVTNPERLFGNYVK